MAIWLSRLTHSHLHTPHTHTHTSHHTHTHHITSHSPLPPLYPTDRPGTPTGVSLSPLIPLKLNLSWAEPYSHPNISLSYTITITSLDTTNRTATGPSHLETVLDTSNYIFKLDTPSCDTYAFTVSAVNEAGASEPSEALAGSLPLRESHMQCQHHHKSLVYLSIDFSVYAYL